MVACGIRRRVVGCWRLIRPGRVTTRRGRCVCRRRAPSGCAACALRCKWCMLHQLSCPSYHETSCCFFFFFCCWRGIRRLRRPWAVSSAGSSAVSSGKVTPYLIAVMYLRRRPTGLPEPHPRAYERALPSKYTPYSAPLGCCLLCSGYTGPDKASCGWRLGVLGAWVTGCGNSDRTQIAPAVKI